MKKSKGNEGVIKNQVIMFFYLKMHTLSLNKRCPMSLETIGEKKKLISFKFLSKMMIFHGTPFMSK